MTKLREPADIAADKSLAINGGTPRLDAFPWEDAGICTDAADAVAEVVRSGRTVYWGGGPKAREFEERFARHIGRSKAFFHNSGTAALHTALLALDIRPGDPVALASSGFVAALNAVHHVGARPVFLPTDPTTMVCASDVSQWADDEHAAALVTHFFGNVVDVEAVRNSLGSCAALIEDAGQAHGALLRGRPVGSFGEIGSFAGSHKKLVTAGQGGINVYDDPDIDRRMRTVSHHGKSGKYVSEVPGFNFRGGEMEAVLALAALDRLEQRVAERNASAQAMTDIFDEAGLRYARVSPGLDCRPAWFDVCLIMPEEWVGLNGWLADLLEAEHIPAWLYPSLIEMPWVEGWMAARGWWGERERTLLGEEKALWSRCIQLGTQMRPTDAKACASALVDIVAA
jgi:dTDP-4-amino-4,6-dideoxygalactose transaminase